MAVIKSSDFNKPASSGVYAGETRDKIFELKIKDNKKFILGANKNGKEITGISYNKKTRELTYQDTNKTTTVKYTQIYKDPDFGGGSGSGGGAADTALTESLQCFYCSYVFNYATTHPCKSVTPAQLKQASTYVKTDKTLEQCLNSGPADWIDTDVYLKTANEMYRLLKFKKSKVYFHRGSTFMSNIYAAKAACHANDKKSAKPQAPGSFSHDKWNPGDIWASTLEPSNKPLEKFTTSWGELNGEVLRLGGSGLKTNIELLGISLKKIAATATKATLKEFSTPEMKANRQTYEWQGYTYGKTGDFFNSQDIYVKISGQEVQFRTFGGSTSWQGEVKGASAAGGKIGGGNVDFYLKDVFSKSVFGNKVGESQFLNETKTAAYDYNNKLYEAYKRHRAGQTTSKPEMTKELFMAELEKQDDNFKNSKILCMNFLDAVMSGNTQQRNEFATKLFRYASSDTDQSSYFVKIY
jgi:hypothetical protein